MDGLKIVLICTVMWCVGCYAYGQIALFACPEFFTDRNPSVFRSYDPASVVMWRTTVNLSLIGIVLGLIIAWVCQFSKLPRYQPKSLFLLLTLWLFGTFAVALNAAFVGWLAAISGWVTIENSTLFFVPVDKHIAYIVVRWMTIGCAVGAIVGFLFTIFRIMLVRGQQYSLLRHKIK